MRFQRATLFNPFGFPRGLRAAFARICTGVTLFLMSGMTVYAVIAGGHVRFGDVALAFGFAVLGAPMLFWGVRTWPK